MMPYMLRSDQHVPCLKDAELPRQKSECRFTTQWEYHRVPIVDTPCHSKILFSIDHVLNKISSIS